MKKIINSDVIFGTVVLAICVWFFVEAQTLSAVSIAGSINAGFFPQMLAITVGLMSVVMMVQGFCSPKSYFSAGVDKKNIRLFLGTVILFGLYVMLWKTVHFIPLTLVFLLGMSFLLKLSLRFAVIYSVIMSCGLFYLFAGVFKIILN